MNRRFFVCVLLLLGALAGPGRADTLAYWRFENGVPGDYAVVGRSADSEGANGNPLWVWARETRPLYSGDVPLPSVPQTGASNRVAAAFNYSEDFFTREAPFNTTDFGPQGANAWTVELSFKLASLDGVGRLAGRDGVTPDVDERGPLQIVVVGNADKFDVRAEILDGKNRFRAAVSAPVCRAGQWYNLAATADSKALKLYLDALDGRGYQLVAQTAIEGALNQTTGVFSLGRGFATRPGGNIGGLLDEVRISDVALSPAQFLFSRPDGSGLRASAAPPLIKSAPLALLSGADPDVGFYGGKFWMYITSRGNHGPRNPVFYVYSSPDLKRWTKSAQPIFEFKDAPWIAANGRPNNGGWAPSTIEKDGQYYFYYSVGPQNAQGPARIGVALSSSPAGPFTDSGAPLLTGERGFEAIDPMVFHDPKSDKYLLYAGGSAWSKLRVWELAPDMVHLAREVEVETPPQFSEAPYMHLANGRYYLSYSHGNYANASYSVHYAVSDSPTGPWQYRGPILRSDWTHKGPGHHAFVRDPRDGQWVIVYHRWQSPDGGNPFKAGRSIAIAPLHYDSTGAIMPIEMDDADIPILEP